MQSHPYKSNQLNTSSIPIEPCGMQTAPIHWAARDPGGAVKDIGGAHGLGHLQWHVHHYREV